MPDPIAFATAQLLREDTDLCVKCGLCLPHCPTYHLFAVENESPRGRLSLIQALANNKLDWSQAMDRALNSCLGCRACERVCPALVPYGQIHDRALHFMQQLKTSGLKEKLLRYMSLQGFFRNKTYFHMGMNILRWYQNLGLSKFKLLRWLRHRSGLAYWEQMCPTIAPPVRWRAVYRSAHGQQAIHKKKVGLFLGCVAAYVDQRTLLDTIFVLNKLGYDVHIPEQQFCCGALHAHNGDRKSAAAHAQDNLRIFSRCGVETILYTASGCGAFFMDYPDLLDGSPLPMHFMEIGRYLLDQTDIKNIPFKPLHQTMALHLPCTVQNVLRDSRAVFDLCALIPGVKMQHDGLNKYCCGAAGSYMLTHAANANRLRHRILHALTALKPEILLTCNIGCAIHLQNGIKTTALTTKILHPISLLRSQWPDPVI